MKSVVECARKSNVHKSLVAGIVKVDNDKGSYITIVSVSGVYKVGDTQKDLWEIIDLLPDGVFLRKKIDIQEPDNSCFKPYMLFQRIVFKNVPGVHELLVENSYVLETEDHRFYYWAYSYDPQYYDKDYEVSSPYMSVIGEKNESR